MKHLKKYNENIFGWSYPPGAANDPSAPYNQSDDEYVEILGFVQDTIVEHGDMNEIDAENYLEDVDFSDFAEMCDIILNNNPAPWEPISFDENDYPIYPDNEYQEWEREIRKNNSFKEAQKLIKERKKELKNVWYKEISEKIYEYLKKTNFPINFSYKIQEGNAFRDYAMRKNKIVVNPEQSVNTQPVMQKKDRTLTVSELIEKLKTLPQDYRVQFYEDGSVYDSPVTKAYISQYDKKNKNKWVTLTNK